MTRHDLAAAGYRKTLRKTIHRFFADALQQRFRCLKTADMEVETMADTASRWVSG